MATSTSGPKIAEQNRDAAGSATVNEQRLLDNWLAIQGINLARHATSRDLSL